MTRPKLRSRNRLLPLELRDEGAARGSRRCVLAKDYAHRHGHGTRNTFDANLHQGSTVEVRLNHVQGHVPPSQASLEEGVLSSQVREAPGEWRQHAEVTAITERGAVGEDQLYVLANGRCRGHAAALRQRMRGTDDRHKRYVQKRFGSKLVRHEGQRADDADAAMAIENRFDDPTEGLDVEPQRCVWIGRAAVYRCPRERFHRVHHVHCNGEVGLEALAHGAGPGFEFIDVVRHRAGISKKTSPFLGEPRVTGGAIEEPYAKLRFQIGERLAHDRLGAALLAARG